MADNSQESGSRDSLLEAVEHLENAKQRYTDAGLLVKTIAEDAYENGIRPAVLTRLLKILTTKNNLDQGTVTTLVKNLYPQERISSKNVTQVICSLGPSKNKPTPATQALLLRWLILSYDLLRERAHLAKLYAVLFNHLDMISLRKPLCHLLSLITRRKHVKPFRIQALMELIQISGGDEKELVALLRIFKNYYPEIILGELGRGRNALFFKHPDPEWSTHAKYLQDQSIERAQASSASTFQVVHRGAVKRSRVAVVIPPLQSSRVSHKHTSLEELRDVGHLVETIDKIELPNQIISTLGDAMAQKYLHLVHSELADHRLDEWMRSFLEDKLELLHEDEGDDQDTLASFLEFVVQFVSYIKELPAAIRSFLSSYLQVWNGRDNRAIIFCLLQYIDIEPIEALKAELFTPMESAVLDESLGSRMALLEFYTGLISQWGVKLRSRPVTSDESLPLSQTILHAELLASSILEISAEQDQQLSKPSSISVLDFYKTLSDLFSHAPQDARFRLTLPNAQTVYTLAFIPSAAVISTLNSILAVYKSAFEACLSSQVLQAQNSPAYGTDLVGRFNGYVMDMCNVLWRNRALNTEDPNALGCLVPAPTVAALGNYVKDVSEAAKHYDRENAFYLSVASIFSLSHHAAFCNLSAACFAELERDQGISDDRPRLQKPVTQKVLLALEKDGGAKTTWQEYRVHMLDWLDGLGCRGTGILMRSTMKALRKE
ncbi:uncharacterized protein N7506_009502 [Penicillium brevicompactum]|uniref:uncharacterized protein n=1 Tax=Penicillium brevicompactum TaxID=5074 RepID=UPI0025405560|nr:uncharacterized protein N7506_009502 [Penicillium brevicompactum]KAJ5326400.1 hypothetical protein N7506_009502 [Penicillium brevicompactum]